MKRAACLCLSLRPSMRLFSHHNPCYLQVHQPMNNPLFNQGKLQFFFLQNFTIHVLKIATNSVL
jgi:hypothetical protein